MKILALKILHYLWNRKENIYSLYFEIKKNKNIKIDGKTDFEEILEYSKLIKTSGLMIEESDDVPLGSIDVLVNNPHKNLIQYQQSSWKCVIYAVCRVFTYNTGIVLTKDEVESVGNYAHAKGLWIPKRGMTFKNGLQALDEWLMENKNISIRYDRVRYGSKMYQERKDKDYSCVLGGYITDKYLVDFNTDGTINQNYVWNEKKKYGHCWSEEEKFTDNYPVRLSNNRYINDRFTEFISKGYMFSYAYFIFLDDEVVEKESGSIFLKDSKFQKFIDIKKELPFNDYKDSDPARISDVKELITLWSQRGKSGK